MLRQQNSLLVSTKFITQSEYRNLHRASMQLDVSIDSTIFMSTAKGFVQVKSTVHVTQLWKTSLMCLLPPTSQNPKVCRAPSV